MLAKLTPSTHKDKRLAFIHSPLDVLFNRLLHQIQHLLYPFLQITALGGPVLRSIAFPFLLEEEGVLGKNLFHDERANGVFR